MNPDNEKNEKKEGLVTSPAAAVAPVESFLLAACPFDALIVLASEDGMA